MPLLIKVGAGRIGFIVRSIVNTFVLFFVGLNIHLTDLTIERFSLNCEKWYLKEIIISVKDAVVK
jgi:hypothetical protein